MLTAKKWVVVGGWGVGGRGGGGGSTSSSLERINPQIVPKFLLNFLRTEELSVRRFTT